MRFSRFHPLLTILLAYPFSGFAAEPLDITAAQLAAQPTNAMLRLSGVVTAVYDDDIDEKYYWTILQDRTGSANVAFDRRTYPISNVTALVDAEVAFTGHRGHSQAYRRTLDAFLMHDGTPPRILKPVPEKFQQIPYHGRHPSLHRERLKCTVLAVTRDAFYVNGHLKVVPRRGEVLPRSGDRVMIAGFFHPYDPGGIVTDATLLRTEPSRQEPFPELPVSDVEHLFRDDRGNARVDARKGGSVIRLVGDVVTRSQSAREAAAFELTCGRRTIYVDASAFPADADEVVPGCRMDVTGLVVIEFERAIGPTRFTVVKRICLVPRTREDLRVIARPPWWTPGRLLVVIAVLALVAAALGVLSRFLWNRANRKAREALHDRLARAHAESRTEERTRLASDLHDTLAQNLTGVTLQLDSARKALLRRPEAVGRHLDTAERILRSLRTELRRCIWDLRYEALDLRDFDEAIRMTVEPVLGEARLAARVPVRRSLLSDSIAHAALSIVRELVSNAVRHGGAETVRVAGCIDAGILRMSVNDDGSGFDPERAPGIAEGHFGLVGIRDRVRAFRGEFTVEAGRARGCTVTFSIPLESKDHEREKKN